MTDSAPDTAPSPEQTDPPALAASRLGHRLHVESADEWEFVHDDCPIVDLGGYWDHDCLLGRIVRYEGFDVSEVAPGDYAATAWACQSTEPRTFGEWESGIELTPEVPDAT